jgi:hypothetical protein
MAGKPTATLKKTVAALALAFAAAASGSVQAQPGHSYTVIEISPQTSTVTLPDRELPPPGSARDAALRWMRPLPSDVKQYTVLLQDEAGNFAQCTGLRIDLQPAVDRYWYKNLAIDLVAFDTEALRLMRTTLGAENWPIRAGGCIPLSPQEARQGTHAGQVGLKYGPNIEQFFSYRTYTAEAPGAEQRRQDMINIGRSVSTRMQGNRCDSAGWNETLAQAKPGDRITLPGLCSR